MDLDVHLTHIDVDEREDVQELHVARWVRDRVHLNHQDRRLEKNGRVLDLDDHIP